ncbi:MAG: hypothetical protein ABJ263_13100 [Tateyamaria sp.]
MANILPNNKRPQKRMDPPEDFTDEQRDIWLKIVNSVPDWHLTSQHFYLVRRICIVIEQLVRFEGWCTQTIIEDGIDALVTDDLGVAMNKRTISLASEMRALYSSLKLEPQKVVGQQDLQKRSEQEIYEDGDGLLYRSERPN